MKRTLTATPEVLIALREVIACKIRFWDAMSAAERLLGDDVEFDIADGDTLASVTDNPEDAAALTDDDLIEAFHLNKPVAEEHE